MNMVHLVQTGEDSERKAYPTTSTVFAGLTAPVWTFNLLGCYYRVAGIGLRARWLKECPCLNAPKLVRHTVTTEGPHSHSRATNLPPLLNWISGQRRARAGHRRSVDAKS